MENSFNNLVIENVKDLIIVILACVLLYLIYKKNNKSKKSDNIYKPNKPTESIKSIRPLYPYKTRPIVDMPNEIVTNEIVTNEIVTNINQMLPNINQMLPNINQPVQTYKDACANEELLPINSNGLSNYNILSNMSDHELIHIDDSKPFITNEEIPITNLPELNTIQLYEHFNYVKDFDEENFDYYDPTGLYNDV
jgi:hypothetical protein